MKICLKKKKNSKNNTLICIYTYAHIGKCLYIFVHK